jgi:hypothetical protein
MLNFFSLLKIFFFVFFVLGNMENGGAVWAQNAKNTVTPYDAGEFPQWAKDLRRFEVIAFGSFPFAFFTASFITDSARFFQHNYNMAYAPWPLKPAGAYDPTTEEKLTTIGAAVALSISVAVIDFIIVQIKRHKQRKAYTQPADNPIIIRSPMEKEKREKTEE